MTELPTEAMDPALPQTLEQCHELIRAMAQQVKAQQEQLARLQEKVEANSDNTSKPPSSDGPFKPNRAQRRASERSRGAQKGHKGTYRQRLDETQVDRIEDVLPPSVCECGAAVQVQQGDAWKHQVFEVPPVVAQVTEYRLYRGVCAGCGQRHRAKLPPGVPRGQLGPRALALIGTLGTKYHLTQRKVRDCLAHLMGVDFSLGAISQAHGMTAQALATPLKEASEWASRQAVVHMDETHYRREGSGSHWVWALVTPQVAVFDMLPSRASYVPKSLVGQAPEGIVVSDRYSAYAYVDPEHRQICWAHLLRDFTRMAQRAGEPARIGQRLLGLGYVLFRWRDQGRPAKNFAGLRRRVKTALQRGAAQTHCLRTARTCANLLGLEPALWTFLDHTQVPPTNNAAEQALRPLVIKRKISGPVRSKRGQDFIAHGFSAMETCRRQKRDFFDYLHQAITAWVGTLLPPSLVPQV